ncbi:MBL fold metallo-hydrolase [Pseudohoeflea coraliihabitans]|uniref:MBL fold metallo-hydrolase n=1 Tax=Pseudohoeflea coraliihabitans TaxID=2860393 RepID=A0ABS6WJG9_9HYPH|nr:MBL fold metallo-hydrolase [Pseudohoeflea sp. DP4N28-3]MBW3096088.1 MBL fold metallo-hydrolase [Pseudohoeflea sp. DP4N28-3]
MGELRAGIVPVTPFQQNCTILFDAESLEGVVIDPGGDVERIAAAIKEAKIVVKEIWITHGHLDHAGGADELRERLGVKVIGPHRADEMMLARLSQQAQQFGLAAGDMRDLVPDTWLDEGDSVQFGEHKFEVLHTPGHAPGHVIFYNRKAGFAHVGDVLFSGSVGRTDLPGGDHQTLLNSIRDKVLPLGDATGFICGHGPGGTIGEERRSNPFLKGL